MRKKIGALLFIFGILTGLYYVYLTQDSIDTGEEIVQIIEEQLADDVSEEVPALPSNPLEGETFKGLNLEEITGIIEIPVLGVKAPLVDGEEDRLLRYAVGRIEDSAQPGQSGNFVVGGHRNYIYSSYFRYLYKLSEGDIINVKTYEGNYTYKVVKTDTVRPDEVWVMDNTPGFTGTFITCTTDGKKRTVVFTELIKD